MRLIWAVAFGLVLGTTCLGQYFERLGHGSFAWFMPDPNTIFLIESTRAYIYDVVAKQVLQEFHSPRGQQWISGTTSPDGKLVAGVFSDGSLLLWEVPNGRLVAQHILAPFCGIQTAFLGKNLVLSGWYFCHDTKIIEPFSGEVVLELPNTIAPIALIDQFIAGVKPLLENQIVVWDVSSGKLVGILELPAEVLSMTADFDGNGIYIGAKNGVIYFLDLKQWQVMELFVQGSPVLALALNPRVARLAASSRDDRLVVWDLAHQKAHYDIDVRAKLLEKGWLPSPQIFWTETLFVRSTSWSYDGIYLLLVSITARISEDIFLVKFEP